tara:strand:+ start:61 stop:1116 length:1056 start_codon:yes stop_codon:yes gene_type:complete
VTHAIDPFTFKHNIMYQMTYRRMNSLQWLLLGLLLSLIGCSTSTPNPETDANEATTLTPVTLQLNWFPEAEHGGYYAALEHGFFSEEGLDVTILPGGPNASVIQQVALGRIDFAVTNADRVIFARDADIDVTALMAPIQNTPRCIMVHQETGITQLQDLRDVTLAIGTGPAFFKYMQLKLPLQNVKTVAYTGSIGAFLIDKQYAQQAYVFSEPFIAQQQGAKPVTLMLSELGYNPYASVLVTRTETTSSRSDLTRRMVRASVRGWEQYLTDAKPTNSYIDSLNDEIDMAALEFGAQALAKLCRGDEAETPIGTMTEKRWETLIDQLEEIDAIEDKKVIAADVFNGEYLPAP